MWLGFQYPNRQRIAYHRSKQFINTRTALLLYKSPVFITQNTTVGDLRHPSNVRKLKKIVIHLELAFGASVAGFQGIADTFMCSLPGLHDFHIVL